MTGNDIDRRPKIQATLRAGLPVDSVADITNTAIPEGANPEEGEIRVCSNGDAGLPSLAVYYGGAWLRVPLGAAISAT